MGNTDESTLGGPFSSSHCAPFAALIVLFFDEAEWGESIIMMSGDGWLDSKFEFSHFLNANGFEKSWKCTERVR